MNLRSFRPRSSWFPLWLVLLAATPAGLGAAGQSARPDDGFPMPLAEYHDPAGAPVWQILVHRVGENPFNLAGTLIFFCAIAHTFMAGKFTRWAHHLKHAHEERMRALGESSGGTDASSRREQVSFRAEIMHFLGEVEAIFGLWVVPLVVAIALMYGFETAQHYIAWDVNFTEPMFVVVIMTIAATRPVVKLAESMLGAVARLGGGTPTAWWLSILTVGPLLGSFITEPAAMTISALLLARKFYDIRPTNRLKYGTLGLLFVNISVGGTLTHFAAPPVLMVAARWQWDTPFMIAHFGWKAAVGIVVANLLYFLFFQRDLRALAAQVGSTEQMHPWHETTDFRTPAWVTVTHVLFLAWTVAMVHYPALFIGGFLFFLAFAQATYHHQDDIRLKPALLVGFFLAGLVIHGNLQQWWIGPVLRGLDTLPLFFGAAFLTAFNDNAAITYLATLVPGLTPELKYAVVAGAVTGGGLTVIANAPNPAGQSILARFFDNGISPLYLALGAIVPTVIVGLCFVLL